MIPEVRGFKGWIPFVLADLCDIALQNGDLGRAREYAERTATGGGARAAGSLAEVCLQQETSNRRSRTDSSLWRLRGRRDESRSRSRDSW